MAINSILVSQPAPGNTTSPFTEITNKYGIEIFQGCGKIRNASGISDCDIDELSCADHVCVHYVLLCHMQTVGDLVFADISYSYICATCVSDIQMWQNTSNKWQSERDVQGDREDRTRCGVSNSS